jgi:hypothetical protein
VKQAGAPEARTAGNTVRIAVLLEIRSLRQVTECKAAVKAEGKIITQNALPEFNEFGGIPDLENVMF